MADAEYYRNYRKLKKPRNERDAHVEGLKEGIALAVKFCREVIAGRAYTGFQVAIMIDKAMIGAETGEQAQRRAMVDSIRGAETR